ncbi:MAG: translocation/assembly module TamB domain-containing protein [Proteobacteria bacterium]|nr:translocation/assembly module TamB domain-containing protein [Pseudomonadota bacterium]
MRWLRILGWTVGGFVLALVTLFVLLQTPAGLRTVAHLASSSDLSVSGLGGFIPTDVQVERIELRDKQGVWLSLDGARVRWSFASLFSGRVWVEELRAAKIDVVRPPLPSEEKASSSSSGSFGIPVGVDLRALSVDDLHVGAALGGVDSRWKLAGSGLLTADGSASHLKLEMDRTDGPTARLAADLGFSLDRFSVDGQITAEESTRGGVVAALIGRPDLERMSLKLTAKGDRSAGAAELVAAAGDAVNSTGNVHWQRQDAAIAITTALSVVGPGLPDSPIARLLRSPATLNGEATVDDAGLVVVKQGRLKIGPAQLDATGKYDTKADKLDAVANLRTAESGPLSDLAGGAQWSALQLDVQATGSGLADKPQVTATLKGSAQDVALPMLGDKAPPPGPVAISAKLGMDRNGKLTIDGLDATTALANLKGGGSYLPSTEAADGRITLEVPELAAFSKLANLPLGGRGHIELTASHDKDGQKAGWQGSLDELTLDGVPPGLLQESLKLSGAAALRPDRAWRLDKVAMASPGFAFEMSGTGRDRTGSIDMTLKLPKLGVLQPDVGGSAEAAGKLMMTPTGGDLQLTVNTTDLSRGGIASKKLALMLDTALEGDAVHGRLKAEGDLANQPVALEGQFARNADGGIQVPNLKGSWASANVDFANLAVTPSGATGHGHLTFAKLEDLAPLVGTALAGAIDLDIATEPDNAGKVKVTLRGDNLRSGATGVQSLQLDATVADPMGVAAADASLKADGLSGISDLRRATVTVKGDTKAFDATVAVAGAVTDANLAARIEPSPDEIKVALQKFDGRYQGIPIALASPTQARVMGARVTIDPTGLRLGGGTVRLSGVVDPADSNLTVDVSGLPLSLADRFAPGTNLEGSLQAKAQVNGALANPRVQASYSLSGVRVKRPETALLPALALQGTASMADRQASVDARLSAGAGTNLTIRGKGSPSGQAQVTLGGSIDIAPFSPALGLSVRNVRGTVRPDLTVNIDGQTITGSGTVSLTGATLSLPASGMQLSGGEGLISLQGDTLQIQRLRFQTARNGTIDVTGSARLDPAQGFPVDLAVNAQRALLVSRPDLVASISSNIKINGSTLNGFDVTGPVTIDRAELSIAASQTASYPTVPVTEINGTTKPDAATAPPSPPPTPVGPREPANNGVRLALNVQAPQAVFVRGRGLDAEVGGQFTVTGDPSAPAVLGNLTLRRGDFNLMGHRLTFTRGNVSLMTATTIDPLLDFAATTTVQSTTIEVDITGSSRAPKIELTSSPSLPQDEVMAMLLFGKPSSSLSPMEVLSAAQALAELTGKGGGGALGRLRGSLGLDQLSINSGGGASNAGTTSVEGGRYVAPGVYVGARQGASADSSRAVVEWEVFKHTKVEGDIGADSNGKVGVKMEWDY